MSSFAIELSCQRPTKEWLDSFLKKKKRTYDYKLKYWPATFRTPIMKRCRKTQRVNMFERSWHPHGNIRATFLRFQNIRIEQIRRNQKLIDHVCLPGLQLLSFAPADGNSGSARLKLITWSMTAATRSVNKQQTSEQETFMGSNCILPKCVCNFRATAVFRVAPDVSLKITYRKATDAFRDEEAERIIGAPSARTSSNRSERSSRLNSSFVEITERNKPNVSTAFKE